jgi:hypothetical protein
MGTPPDADRIRLTGTALIGMPQRAFQKKAKRYGLKRPG